MIWQWFEATFINERVYITFFSEILATVILAVLTRKLYQKYRDRNTPATKYLAFTTFFMTLTTSLQMLDPLVLDYFAKTARVGLGLAFGCSAVANIFLYIFMLEIFYTGKTDGGVKFKIFAGVEGSVAILTPIVAPFYFDGFTILLIVHVIFALSLLSALVVVITRAIRKATDPAAKKGFAYIRGGVGWMIATYVLLIVDNFWTLLVTPGVGYSYFGVAGMTCAWITGIFLYLGFVGPSKK